MNMINQSTSASRLCEACFTGIHCHNMTVYINVIAMNNDKRMQLVTQSHGLCH